MRRDSGEIHFPAERGFNQAVLPVSVMSDSSSAIKFSHVAQRHTCVWSAKTHGRGQTQHSVSSSTLLFRCPACDTSDTLLSL